jgi:hypothetical protein
VIGDWPQESRTVGAAAGAHPIAVVADAVDPVQNVG